LGRVVIYFKYISSLFLKKIFNFFRKYINYKKLKQELQSQTFSVGDGSKSLEDSEEEFFYLLCQELERVILVFFLLHFLFVTEHCFHLSYT
jgi:SPX domain protein involved in polyphosphate accumulation